MWKISKRDLRVRWLEWGEKRKRVVWIYWIFWFGNWYLFGFPMYGSSENRIMCDFSLSLTLLVFFSFCSLILFLAKILFSFFIYPLYYFFLFCHLSCNWNSILLLFTHSLLPSLSSSTSHLRLKSHFHICSLCLSVFLSPPLLIVALSYIFFMNVGSTAQGNLHSRYFSIPNRRM